MALALMFLFFVYLVAILLPPVLPIFKCKCLTSKLFIEMVLLRNVSVIEFSANYVFDFFLDS